MKKIFPLSQNIIAKIAAGEVIERPVFAVKELVENALDAQADSIIVHIEESGLKKIVVIDNGHGMDRADLEESFKLHTTSKILSIEQLSHIATLGFRGEALASIAAISNLTIQSRTKDAASGTIIEIKNGQLEKVSPIGMPVGTTISVTNLFHSVPGRQKFLKSSKTEFRHIINLLTQIALVNPEVHFMLTHNKKMIFDLPKTIDIRERIDLLLGSALNKHLLPVSYQDSYITINGFLATPQTTVATNNKQFLFVNDRHITDKLLAGVIKDAYGTLLSIKNQPVFILFLTLPFEFVDVNVHPRKEYVRFANTQLLRETMQKVVTQTLTRHNQTYYNDTSLGFGLGDNTNITHSFAGRLLKENQIPWDIRTRKEILAFADIIQLHNVYLVTQTRFGIVLIDQHAAHERILYEQFQKGLKDAQKETPLYHLAKSYLIELSLSESELLREHLSLFHKLGFDIAPFKDNVFALRTVPLLFHDRKPEELISEVLSDLEEGKNPKDIDTTSQKLIAYLACRASIKAGEQLAKKQVKDLVEKLEQTPHNATCPHGRPTKIIIDLEQLHKMFKRK